MRLRAVLRRFIVRIARLLGRAAASEHVQPRPLEQAARRPLADRSVGAMRAAPPGSFFPARLDADAETVFLTPDPAPLPFGDFADRGEAERFAVLPPIGAGAGDDVDWDALARALTD